MEADELALRDQGLQGAAEFGGFHQQSVFARRFGDQVFAAEIRTAQLPDALNFRQHFRRHVDPLADVVAPVAAPQPDRQQYAADRQPAALVQAGFQTA